MALAVAVAAALALSAASTSYKEITYKEFVSEYLATGRVCIIEHVLNHDSSFRFFKKMEL